MSEELHEREAHLERLRELLAGAALGRGRLVAIEGPAGIGKTALLAAACAIAESSGSRVLRGRAGEMEFEFPYGVVRQLFEPLLNGREDREHLLRGAAALAAPVVAPWIASPVEGVAADAPFSVAHGLYWLTANLAEEAPLVIAVDDAHWADIGSLRFLLHLAHRLEGVSVLVLAATRTGEPARHGAELSALRAQPGVERLRPQPLSAESVARMIDARLDQRPDARFAAACHRVTGGSPFLVGELLSELAERGIRPGDTAIDAVEAVGSENVARSTLRRLATLPPSAAALARAASVLGGDGRLHVVAKLAGVDEDEAAGMADALAARDILRPGRPLDFVHPIVRSAIYQDLPAGARAVAHGRAADLLTEEHADLDAVAGHLLLSEPRGRPEIVGRLREAAAGAVDRGAPESASSYLQRALEEGGLADDLRARLLAELGFALKLRDPAPAIEHLEAALTREGEPLRRARILSELADALFFVGRWERAMSMLEKGIEENDGEVALQFEVTRATRASWDARLFPALWSRLPELQGMASEKSVAGRMMALVVAGATAWLGESSAEVHRLLDVGLTGNHLWADLRGDSSLFAPMFIALVLTEQLDRALRLADELAEDARSRGSISGLPFVLMFRAWIHARRGDLASAEADLRPTLELARASDLRFAEINGLWGCTDGLVERAELADVAREVPRLRVGPELRMLVFEASALEARGRVRLSLGQIAEGIADLERCARTPFARSSPNGFSWRPALALALAATDRERALDLANEHLEAARAAGMPRPTSVALRTLGLIEGSIDHLEESVRQAEAAPARLEHARSLVELGAALRRANRRADAREPLRLGLDLAHRCGATRLAQRAQAELSATGARPRRAVLTGVDALTPTERRIAAMAGGGMSNPEIAQALFVTRKTVENHLARAYGKLGISSRAELPQIEKQG